MSAPVVATSLIEGELLSDQGLGTTLREEKENSYTAEDDIELHFRDAKGRMTDEEPLRMTVNFAMRHFKKLRALLRIDEHLSVLTVQWISRSDFKLLTDIISQETFLGGPHTNTNDQNQLEPLYIDALESGCHYVWDVVLSTLHTQLQDGEIPVDLPCYNTCYSISHAKDWEAIHFWSGVIASRFATLDPAADPSGDP